MAKGGYKVTTGEKGGTRQVLMRIRWNLRRSRGKEREGRKEKWPPPLSPNRESPPQHADFPLIPFLFPISISRKNRREKRNTIFLYFIRKFCFSHGKLWVGRWCVISSTLPFLQQQQPVQEALIRSVLLFRPCKGFFCALPAFSRTALQKNIFFASFFSFFSPSGKLGAIFPPRRVFDRIGEGREEGRWHKNKFFCCRSS